MCNSFSKLESRRKEKFEKKYGKVVTAHLKAAIQGCNSKFLVVKLQFLSTYSFILLQSLPFSPVLLALSTGERHWKSCVPATFSVFFYFNFQFLKQKGMSDDGTALKVRGLLQTL